MIRPLVFPAALLLALLFPAAPAEAQRYKWTTFAGNEGGKGTAEGLGVTAKFL